MFIFPKWDVIRKYFTGCSTSSYVFNIHPDKVFISRFHVMCIHDLPQHIEQKQDNYVCKFLEKPWTWNLPFIDEGQWPMYYRYANADLKICQYLCLHMNIICLITLHVETPFTFSDMRTWDMWKVCLQTFRNNRIC